MQAFTVRERALTLTGLAPLALIGCAVHARPDLAAQNAPSYAVSIPVPPPRPIPVQRPPEAPAALRANIAMLTQSFDGVVGVSVRSVEQGWKVESNAERRMPQQSVSKLWVTMAALDLRDQGKLTLDDAVTIRKEDLTLFHQPVAVLVKEDGYQTTVRELIRRAMTMSDNTCNDRLLRFIGGPQAVRAFIERKQLGAIRFGPGERLLQSQTAGLAWRQEYALGNAFAQARARLPSDVRQAAFESYVADPIDGASAGAIAGALAKLKRGELLSPGSTDWLLATMADSKTGKARLRGAIPPGWSFGHKTGTGQDLLSRTAGFNDVGLLTAPDGRSYAIAVMIGDTRRPVRERQELMQAVAAAVVANHG
jgi:beta-lactamase class A